MHRAALPAVLLAILALPAPGAEDRPIVLGRGAILGSNTAGLVYYEELFDWNISDLRALDPIDARSFADGLDASRDLVAFYSRLEGDRLFLRLDLLDLALGAEAESLDLYVLIDCAPGGAERLPGTLDELAGAAWELAVVTRDTERAEVLDAAGVPIAGAHLGSYWRSDLDAVELGIRASALRDAGWDGTSPITFHLLSAHDRHGLADQLGEDGDITDRSTTGRAKLAIVAHGNQPLERTDALRDRLFVAAEATGSGWPSGFRLTLDVHRVFQLPLNVHLSAPLLAALAWMEDPDPIYDGPSFLEEVARLVDRDQDRDPGAALGGVYAEHILPLVTSAVNRESMRLYEELTRELWDRSAADLRVAHVPERVIESRPPGEDDAFDDLLAAGYGATYLDEVAHLRHWLYPGEPWSGFGGDFDAPHHHKIHRLNGVYCFFINDAEDRRKFWPQDQGPHLEWRRTLLSKALDEDQAQLVLLFDDWEAIAGWSFGSGYNDNAVNYDRILRWVAQHPWIEVVTLSEVLDRATDPAHPLYDPAWIARDHGDLGERPLRTYDYLQHATQDDYRHWYDGSPLEESLRDFVPPIDGQGTPLPSGKSFGDLETPGTLLHDTWQALSGAPSNRVRDLADRALQAMIYETAWHDEDRTDDARDPATDHATWLAPDTTPDRLAGFARELHGHLRDVTVTVAAAHWVADVAAGRRGGDTGVRAVDLDQDGLDEWVLANDRLWLAIEPRGGRVVQGYAYDPELGDGVSILGSSPLHRPSTSWEDELVEGARRSSAFKELPYADAVYRVEPRPSGLLLQSPDGRLQKELTLEPGSPSLRVDYRNETGRAITSRVAVSLDNLDLLVHGRRFVSELERRRYRQVHATHGQVELRLRGAGYLHSPGETERFAVPLVEQVDAVLEPGTASLVLSFGGGGEGTSSRTLWSAAAIAVLLLLTGLYLRGSTR